MESSKVSWGKRSSGYYQRFHRTADCRDFSDRKYTEREFESN